MTINEVAKKLLDMREKRMTGFIMSGVLREELGFEGYGEALRRRWIEADTEQSGMVTVTNNLGMIEDIRKLAAECKDRCGTCGKNQCKCDGRCDSCKGEKCTCESVNLKESETAHFFAQAHAFRRNAGGMGVAENSVAGEPQWDADMEAYYAERRPDLLAHFRNHRDHSTLAEPDRAALWAKHEPGVRKVFGSKVFDPASPGYGGYDTWKRNRADRAKASMHPNGPELGMNDSLANLARSVIQEVATLGLGRTGDAPSVPVPGLGAQSAAPTQSAPHQAQPATPSARPEPVGVGSDVAVVEGGKQYVGKVSKALPDGRYEISFAGERPPTQRTYDKTEVSTAVK